MSIGTGTKTATLDFEASASLAMEGIANEIIHAINSLRKKAGIGISDCINCCVRTTNGFVIHAINTMSERIMSECLINNIDIVDDGNKDIEIIVNDIRSILTKKKIDNPVSIVYDKVSFDNGDVALNKRIVFGEHDGFDAYPNYWEALAALSIPRPEPNQTKRIPK